MAAPLFNRPESCGVDAIPSVDFDFVSDCSIEAPPPPIFDCQPPIVPRDPPPPPCPEFSASVHVNTGYAGCSDAPSEAGGTMVFTQVDDNPCRFLVDLNLDIPIPKPPCPDILGGSVAVNVAYQTPDGACSLPESRIRITKTERDNYCSSSSAAACEFVIDLDLNIPIPLPPCPNIEAGSVSVLTGFKECVGDARGSITINKNIVQGNCSEAPSCDFTIDLDLTIPVPKPPCPAIDGGSVAVRVGYADCVTGPSGAITVTKESIPADCSNGVATCGFTIDLDLDIPIPKPPCPELSEGVVDVKVKYANNACPASPSGAIRITKEEVPGNCETGEPGTCQFTFDLDLDVQVPPPPCPQIEEGSVGINVKYANTACPASPTGAIKINKETIPGDCETGEPDTCQFTIDLNLDIPIPPPPCPQIEEGSVAVRVGYTNCVAGPTGALRVNKTVVPGDCATNTPDTCEFTIDLDLDIPIPPPPCPEIKDGTVKVDVNYVGCTGPGGALRVTKNVIPGECDTTPDTCEFVIDLDLAIPVPKPACPEINLNGRVYLDKDVGLDPGLYIQRNHNIRAPDCNINDPGECTFDFNLDVVIPSFCPEILKGETYFTYTSNPAEQAAYVAPRVDSTTCTFYLDLYLALPRPVIPCAEFYTEGNVHIYDTEDGPTGAITIAPQPREDETVPCNYDVYLDLYLRPSYRLFKGDVSCEWTTCGVDPTCYLTIREPDAAGNQYIDLDIRIPRPPVYTAGKIMVGGYGSGDITITPEDETGCRQQIGASIFLTTTSCGGGGGPSGPTGPTGDCSQNPCPAGCPPGTFCNPTPL